MIVWVETLLPEPDSPTMPRVLPGRREGDTPDGLHDAVGGRERDVQVVDLEQGHATYPSPPRGFRLGMFAQPRPCNDCNRGRRPAVDTAGRPVGAAYVP